MVDDFGWYYEESYARTGHSSQWAAIQDACEDMLDGDDNRTILVGPMRKLSVCDFLSLDNLQELAEEGRLSGDEIVELIASRMCDEVGGCDYGARMSAAQALELRSMIAGGSDYQSILDFVTTYTELESDSVCDGVDPFPIQYAEGKWYSGRNLKNPDAEIWFNAHAGVDDSPLGFTWVVSDEDGFSGEGVATLTDAMAQAEAAVTRHRTSVAKGSE